MIEGLKFLMSADELREHLVNRVLYHKTRQEFYEQKAGELQAGAAQGMGYSSGDPIRNLQDKAREHRGKIDLFKFMHDHVVPGESYQLSDADLMRIEILNRNW